MQRTATLRPADKLALIDASGKRVLVLFWRPPPDKCYRYWYRYRRRIRIAAMRVNKGNQRVRNSERRQRCRPTRQLRIFVGRKTVA